jgi:hypothetical protein
VIIAVVTLVLAVSLIALLVIRPARIVGVAEGELASSVARHAGTETGGCEEVQGGRPAETAWRCHVEDEEGDVTALYAVEAGEWGCWDAKRIEAARGADAPDALSACIWLRDYVRVLD